MTNRTRKSWLKSLAVIATTAIVAATITWAATVLTYEGPRFFGIRDSRKTIDNVVRRFESGEVGLGSTMSGLRLPKPWVSVHTDDTDDSSQGVYVMREYDKVLILFYRDTGVMYGACLIQQPPRQRVVWYFGDEELLARCIEKGVITN